MLMTADHSSHSSHKRHATPKRTPDGKINLGYVALGPHLTRSQPRLFPRRSRRRSLTNAPRGGLEPPSARRLRRAKQPPSVVQHRSPRDRQLLPSLPRFPRSCSQDPPPTPEGLLLRPQPLVLLADPPHQVGVDALQERVHRRPVERTVVVHPTADDRIDALRHLDKIKTGAVVQSPGAQLRTDFLQGLPADRGIERVELLPALGPRPALTEREP